MAYMGKDEPAAMAPGPRAEDFAARQFCAQLAAARQGGGDAQGEILDRCRNYLLTVASRRLPRALRGKLGSSDIAQQTLTQAHAHFHKFHGESEGELLAWLAGILENQVRSAERKYFGTLATNIRREQAWADDPDGDASVSSLVADTPGPARRAAAAEEQAQMRQVLAFLGSEDRELIELRNFELLSYVEIAQRTGRTADAVRKHWARAIERLTELMNSPAEYDT